MKLWDKGTQLSKEVETYTVGDDPMLDKHLVFWDCIASIAHTRMLGKIRLLEKDEEQELINGLKNIIDLYRQSRFTIRQEDEDCHTAIENHLGEQGKKIHTARSRNDQVQAALRLYLKKEIIDLLKSLLDFTEVMVELSRQDYPVAGYSHTRKAMPSTTGLWAASYAESMLDDFLIIKDALKIIDMCPLGSAAGYGVNLAIDREYVSDLLGFSRVQENVLYVQNSRGKFESILLSALCCVMTDLNRLSSDAIMFSMPELGYLEIPDRFTTGSSIMPQKKNPDVFEIMRAKAKEVLSLMHLCNSIVLDLPSGYNRDLQLTKKYVMEGMSITKSSIKIAAKIMKDTKFNEDKCRSSLAKELFAADLAYDKVKQGVAFREAYREIATENIDIIDTEKYTYNKSHTGAPGKIDREKYLHTVEERRSKIKSIENEFNKKIDGLAD